MAERVGILGLGFIGRTVAELLISRGHECWAVRRASTEDFPAAGGRLAGSARELAERVDVLISSLMTVDSAREAFLGPAGAVAGAHHGLIIVEMSTLPIGVKEELRDAVAATPGVLLDCPISGTPTYIKAGKAVIMMSGDERAAMQVKPVLEKVAPKTLYVGPFGTGMKLKLVANFLVAAHTVAASEAMLLGLRLGLDPHQIIEVIAPGAGGSVSFTTRAPIIAERKWRPNTSPAKLFWKDLPIIVEQADALGLSAPMARLCNEYYQKAERAGRLDDEASVIFEILEQEISSKDER